MSDELPEGWAETRLATICSHKSGNSKLIKGKLLPTNGPGRFQGFSASGPDVWRESWECEGDAIVVSAVGARCGKAFKAHGRWSAIANTHIVWANSEVIDRDYLFLHLNNEDFWVKGGSAQPFVKVRETFEHPFSLPPLFEQRRIVAKVEALLAQVSAAGECLAKVPLILERFRQAVLAAACSGRLTEDWRGAHPELVEGLKERLDASAAADTEGLPELPEVPESWATVALKRVVAQLQYGSNLRASAELLDGVPMLRMGNIQEGRIDLRDLKYVAGSDDIEEHKLGRGDVLFNRTNSPELVGKAAVFDVDADMIFASYLIRIRADGQLVEPKYLSWWINSPWGRQWARVVRSDGVSQSNINATKLAHMPVPLPPMEEQQEIVRCVEALFKVTDVIEGRLNAGAAKAGRLQQVILTKAFSGELVPTEADLARAEGRDYEPASVVLERIRAEHTDSLTGGRRRRERLRSIPGGQPGRSEPHTRMRRQERTSRPRRS